MTPEFSHREPQGVEAEPGFSVWFEDSTDLAQSRRDIHVRKSYIADDQIELIVSKLFQVLPIADRIVSIRPLTFGLLDSLLVYVNSEYDIIRSNPMMGQRRSFATA